VSDPDSAMLVPEVTVKDVMVLTLSVLILSVLILSVLALLMPLVPSCTGDPAAPFS
jgi:hypothetical protein